MGHLGSRPLMNRQAAAGPAMGCPYDAVGMQRASHSAIGLPSRSTSASWMLGFLMPAEVSRNLTMRPMRVSGHARDPAHSPHPVGRPAVSRRQVFCCGHCAYDFPQRRVHRGGTSGLPRLRVAGRGASLATAERGLATCPSFVLLPLDRPIISPSVSIRQRHLAAAGHHLATDESAVTNPAGSTEPQSAGFGFTPRLLGQDSKLQPSG